MLRQTFIIIGSLVLASGQAWAAEAGKVIFASGQAQVAGKAGAEGTPVQEGELLSTGADGFLYVKTADNGLFILRPNTQARIVAYRIDRKQPANTQVKLELISGVARSKSGDAVKQARQNFRFNTPVAAIGVRGTDFTVYTDQNTSRVAVLTGGVVVSGFAGGCRPEGGGPCEGMASRELFAAQRGQLIEVTRGATAPQVMQSNSTAPDQVSPPRADEPLAKKSGDGATPSLDARKGDSLEKLAAQHPLPLPSATAPVSPTVPATPEPLPVDTSSPVVEVRPPVVVPDTPAPERAIQWGRWVALAGSQATIDRASLDSSSLMLKRNYVLARTAGADYVLPERGAASFKLQGGEALIQSEDQTMAASFAQMRNGALDVDFGKRTFATSFDLELGAESFNMVAEGEVARDGRFGNVQYARPQSNNMSVDGVLSNADGGGAAYLFQRRLDDQRIANGVTVWGK